MAMITRLLVRVVLVALAVIAGAYAAQAQYTMSLRFDTLTANPGDTVDVDVYYKFTSKPPLNVQDFDVRFDYDTTEIYAFDYILDGTASDSLFTLGTSHQGIVLGDSNQYVTHSLDFTNPILFKIRFQVKQGLGDTAFIRWDTGDQIFEYSDSINVTEQDGWIRTPTVAGHVTLSTPPKTVDTGEVFNIPVSISGIENANIDSALLQFEIDTTRLPFRGASGVANSKAVVQSSSVSGDTISIVLNAPDGHIVDSDSIITVSFYSVPWYDTACVTLQDIRFEALNSGSLIGNTVSSSGSICVVPGSKPPADVKSVVNKLNKLVAYPNPAQDQVTFDAGFGNNSGLVKIEVYDALGRMAFMSSEAYPVWQIPSDIRPGTYFVAMDCELGRFTTYLVIQP
jgi:hypothetical protein